MDKNLTYIEKFQLLQPWMAEIVQDVKKDLKNEHLKVDKKFFLRYFSGKSPAKLTVEELVEAYYTQVTKENDESLAEFVCSRWLLKNTDLYDFFAGHLKGITDDFDNLEELPEEVGNTLITDGVADFGARKTYLFAVINSVVFSDAQLVTLRTAAEQPVKAATTDSSSEDAVLSKKHERELARLENRYEKKLSGLQKKYLTDTAALKKQIANLQRKLNEGQCSGAA